MQGYICGQDLGQGERIGNVGENHNFPANDRKKFCGRYPNTGKLPKRGRMEIRKLCAPNQPCRKVLLCPHSSERSASPQIGPSKRQLDEWKADLVESSSSGRQAMRWVDVPNLCDYTTWNVIHFDLLLSVSIVSVLEFSESRGN